MDSQIATRLGPSRAETLAALRALKPWLEAQGIRRLRLFGSRARDEARPDSDVDLLVEFDHPPGFMRLAGIELAIEDRLGVRVDLGLAEALRPRIAAGVVADAIDV